MLDLTLKNNFFELVLTWVESIAQTSTELLELWILKIDDRLRKYKKKNLHV